MERGVEAVDTSVLALLLGEISGIGDRTLAAVLRRNAVLRRSPGQMLQLPAGQIAADYGLRVAVAEEISSCWRARLPAAVETMRRLRRWHVAVLTLLDATYPARLLSYLDDAPAVVYAHGSLDLLDARLFAAANSNGAPEEALAACDAAAAAGMDAGWWPVTGHNRPAYQRPALVSRRSGGRVCYVLDRGLFDAFGSDLSRELFPAARIWSPAYDPASDLTLSPFAPAAHSLPAHNRRRDALVFALADVVFAGHIRPGGQMQRRCLDALSRGKPVCLVGASAQACAPLREAGAVCRDPVDIPGCLRDLGRPDSDMAQD